MAEHQWAGGPFGCYCGVCGWTWEPPDPTPEIRDFLRLVNPENGSNDNCGGKAMLAILCDGCGQVIDKSDGVIIAHEEMASITTEKVEWEIWGPTKDKLRRFRIVLHLHGPHCFLRWMQKQGFVE